MSSSSSRQPLDPASDAEASESQVTRALPSDELPSTSLDGSANDSGTPTASDPESVRTLPQPRDEAATPTLVRAPDPQIVIPGYEVLEEIGRGGMGVVYKARQKGLGRIVALKTILAGAHVRPAGLARFRTEAETVARLQHPNVVQIHEVGTYNGLPFFSLEYCPGGSLADRLDGTPWAPAPAARLVEILARAVDAAHRAGVIHRDLKPANILLQISDSRFEISDFKSSMSNLEAEIPKITDFGLAKKVGEAGQTHTGAILGTPSYMAPEQAGGRAKDVGPAADIYALGAVLYELLTGRPPFRAATPMDTVMQVVRQEPVPPSRLQPKLPRDLETICLKCLEKDPARRYPSAQALADDLGRFLRSEPIQARPTGSIERLVKWARRRPTLAALGAAGVAAVVGLVALGAWHNFDLQRRVEDASRKADRATRSAALQRLVAHGQTALAKDTPDAWKQAETGLADAVDRAEPDAYDGELAAEAHQVLARLRTRLTGYEAQQTARRQAQEKLRDFLKLRDQALLHATLSIGDDLPANLEATRENARRALARFDISPEADRPPALDAALTPPEKTEVTQDCYLLLLVWAEAEVEGHRSARTALQLLHRADELKIQTRAAHQRRARYLRQLGRQAEARDEDGKARQQPLTDAVDYYLVGDEQYKRGDLEPAVRAFENVLRLKSDHFWARYFLSACFVRMNRFTEAQSFLTDCINQQPGFVWLYLMRGFANGQRNQFTDAEEDFARAEKMLRDRPDDEARYALYTNRAILRAGQEAHVADAIADLQQAIVVRPQRYQAYLTLAQIYRGRKEWKQALDSYNQGITHDPNSAFLYRNRAQFYLERGDLPNALRDYEQAIRVAGARAEAQDLARDHAQRGRILYELKRYEEAVKAFDEAVKAWPAYSKAYLYRAEVLLRLERYEAAVASLEEYGKKGGRPQVEVFRAQADALTRLHRYADAIQAYTLALALRPKDSGLHVARGQLQLALDATRPALRDFERAVALDCLNGEAYVGRGQAQVLLGQPEEAVADAETALRLGPDTSSLLYDTARICALAAGHVDARRAELPPLTPRAEVEAALRLRSEYVARAVALLRRTLNALPTDQERAAFWREHVLRDPSLEPVRGSREFARLRGEYAGLAGKGAR